MPIVKKATVGIRPLKKMFRLSSLSGSIVDDVLDLRGNGLEDDYFTDVATTIRPSTGAQLTGVQISNEKKGNFLRLTSDDIAFTKSFYAITKKFDFEEFLKEFRIIWAVVDAHLGVKNIRRVGFVTEHRYGRSEPSKSLSSSLTKMAHDGYVDKFALSFEDRLLAGGKRPNDEKDAFTNVICNAYDASLDAEFSEEGAININIDVQKYFAPALSGKVPDEVLKLHNKEYQAYSKRYFDQFRKLGVLDGEAT